TVSAGIANMITDKFVDERKLNWSSAEKARVAAGCLGVKKTTGQHPGGLIIVPKDKEIYEFCPIQYPSDRSEDDVITTHFDYHKMENQLVKLDMLGQDDPAQLLLLKEYTNFDFNNIPYDDFPTLKLFSSTESIGLKEQDLDVKTATYAVPEFGTEFVRGMLEDTRPKNIGELIRISGLSHGTDVWQNNAQDLIRSGKIKLNQVISARDDIMLYLINTGMEPHKAFKIMENVRKGRGLKEDEIKLMSELGVPKWYINSCKKIKYLFPKAHAVAYVVMAYKIAYYKVHFPVEFYASFFTIKSDLLNAEYMLMDIKQIIALLKQRQKEKYSLTQKERVEITILEVLKELKLRKIKIKKVDIKKSLAHKSLVENNEILPPLVSIPGLGLKAAENIVAEREKEEFRTIDDFCHRCKINKKVLEELNKFECLTELPESETYSLF
ncbi:PolC-type DNA polymerase III, partial [Candidatus Dependentiae bacterium]|nr:PolC-type DNA polymerase III [Candidatus Dependentiae bacterium]